MEYCRGVHHPLALGKSKYNEKVSFSLLMIALMTGCSKSGGSKTNTGNNGNSGSGNNNGVNLFPLTQGNVWNYRLKTYNPSTGALLDSSNFTLTVNGTTSANGTTYYNLVNSLDKSSYGWPI